MKDIIFMEPIYKDYIWGGTKLKEVFNKNTPYDITAESWEISANENGICKILNKEFENKTLADLFNDKTLKEEIFGSKCKELKDFPILIKFIDAKDNLSIQVHPDDEYAQNVLGIPNGKNEMWYIMNAEKKSNLIVGMNKILNKDELKDIINKNEIKDYLNYIEVEKGDCIYITAGTLHAILKNNFICEIQQNCDITYRVYDWDRVGKDGKTRQLHKKEAIETIKTEIIPSIKKSNDFNEVDNLVDNEYFKVDKINCKKIFKDNTDGTSFYAMNVVEGNGKITFEKKEYDLKMGKSFLIPSNLGEYIINGNIKLLRSYIN